MDSGTIYLASSAALRMRRQQRAYRLQRIVAAWACALVIAAPWLGVLAWFEWPR